MGRSGQRSEGAGDSGLCGPSAPWAVHRPCVGAVPQLSPEQAHRAGGASCALPAGRRLSRSHRSDTSPGVYEGQGCGRLWAVSVCGQGCL